MIILITIILLIIVVFFDFIFPTSPDADPIVLDYQASSTDIRKPNESAIYHSLITSGGKFLITGIDFDIRGVRSPKLGTLADIFAMGLMKSFRFKTTKRIVGKTELQINEISASMFNF